MQQVACITAYSVSFFSLDNCKALIRVFQWLWHYWVSYILEIHTKEHCSIQQCFNFGVFSSAMWSHILSRHYRIMEKPCIDSGITKFYVISLYQDSELALQFSKILIMCTCIKLGFLLFILYLLHIYY